MFPNILFIQARHLENSREFSNYKKKQWMINR